MEKKEYQPPKMEILDMEPLGNLLADSGFPIDIEPCEGSECDEE